MTKKESTEALRVEKISSTAELTEALKVSVGGPRRIELAAGDYYLDEPIRLDERHGGLTLSGDNDVRFIGGKRLKDWVPVTDKSVLNRLSSDVRDHVYQVDLPANGVRDYGHFSRRGWSLETDASHAELFLDGEPLYVTQYPARSGYMAISGFEKGRINEQEDEVGVQEFGFYYKDERPTGWQWDEDIWVHGYWCWDWANSYEHVRVLDTAKGHILTHDPYATTSFKTGQRFCFINVLEELRYPGDFYIDKKNGMLYFYPKAIRPDSELILSTMEQPMLRIGETDDIRIEGLGFESCRASALSIENARGITVDNCHFKFIGTCAVMVLESQKVTIQNSTIHDAGDGGIDIRSGNRFTLEPAEITVFNNHIHHVAKWSRCYHTAVNAGGVGITIEHNLIHDCPHIGILYSGNDFRINHNEMYSLCTDTGDAGAIYSGNCLTFQGIEVCHNFIHHLGGVGMGTMGIYNDDGLSGVRMEDNFFLQVGRACHLGGGIGHEVKNNVYVKCYPALNLDCRTEHREFFWTPMYDGLKSRFYDMQQSFSKPNDPDVKLSAGDPPYTDRYPICSQIDHMFKNDLPMMASAHISGNVFCNTMQFRYYLDKMDEHYSTFYKDGQPANLRPEEVSAITDTRRDINYEWSASKGSWHFEGNYTARPEDFSDVEWADITVKTDSRAPAHGHIPRRLDDIGLLPDLRRENPPTVRTSIRLDIETGEVTLYIRNDSERHVTGEIQLRAGPFSHAYLAFRRISRTTALPESTTPEVLRDIVKFDLRPGEMSSTIVARTDPDTQPALEAHSELAGVRPSRL